MIYTQIQKRYGLHRSLSGRYGLSLSKVDVQLCYIVRLKDILRISKGLLAGAIPQSELDNMDDADDEIIPTG